MQRKSYFETQKNISRVNNSGKRSVCLQNTSEQRALAPLTKVEIIHAVTFRTLLSSCGVLQSPLPFVLTLLYGVYTLLISHEIRRSALWAVFTLQSPLYQHILRPGGGEVPQEGIKRKMRSRTEIRSFQQGLKSGHESTPSSERRYQDT